MQARRASRELALILFSQFEKEINKLQADEIPATNVSEASRQEEEESQTFYQPAYQYAKNSSPKQTERRLEFA